MSKDKCVACSYPKEKFRDYQCPRCYCPQMVTSDFVTWRELDDKLLDSYRNNAKKNGGSGYL